ncbi:hypothetical protein [Nocardia wallacei]|uniref:hypothetical protein n=1 Tax=Nocardia wallacei TaxID=480035 RepID=UPI0024556D16|nr:hypothetical protein [Nocardia wallacei]
MNRSMLIKVLERHPVEIADFDVVVCKCGYVSRNRIGEGHSAWARHVASVIYPETVGSDTTVKIGEAA